MNEKQLALASLALALFGIAVILLFSKGMKPKEVAISDLGANLGNYVEVSGYVSSVLINKENVFVTLCSGECTKVVIFKSIAKESSNPNPYLLEKGARLTVRGEAQEFNGELEVVVLRAGDLESG